MRDFCNYKYHFFSEKDLDAVFYFSCAGIDGKEIL